MSPRISRVPELMGPREAADEIGVEVSNLNALVGLPPPVQELHCGRIWRAADIRAYAADRAARRAKV